MASAPQVFDPSGLGVQNTGVRLTNQRVVLTKIAQNPGASAAELSRLTLLAPQTVGAILVDLEKIGLLRSGDLIRGKRGQPATPYFVDPTGAYAIGIEIGWRHMEAVLVNIGAQQLEHFRREYPFPDARTLVDDIGKVIGKLSAGLSPNERQRIVGVGIAAPGGIARNIGEFTSDAEIIDAWDGFDLRPRVEDAVGIPTRLYNDGNAACWAEFGARPRPRPANLAYILVSTFVGAGIIAGGTLWEGPTGNSANLGSMLVTDRGGHQNFVHRLASIQGLRDRLGKAGVEVPATAAKAWPWDKWEPHVSEWIADAAPALAKVIMNTAAVIEYDEAVVDAVIPSAILDRLIEATQKHLNALPTLTFDRPKLSRGHLGGSAPCVGAAYLPLFRRFFSRDLNHLSEAAA